MDSEALRTFVAIHRAGGFAAAGEQLHRSQPAISRRIAVLEDEIGAPLFDRIAGGIVLSQAGRTLLPHAERVLAALNDARQALDDTRAGEAGAVSVAAVGTLASTELTTVLKRFRAQFPKAKLSLRTATSAEVSQLVSGGQADIGLRYHDDPSDDLVCEPLRPERLVVACAPRHRLAGKTVRSLTALRNDPWLAFPLAPGQGETASHVHAQFVARGAGEIQWTPVDSLTAQKRLVEAGFGLALVPESSVKEERAAKTIAIIRAGDLKASNPVSLIVRKGGYLSAASKRLIEIIRTSF
ncbi:MAG: LysR family transcriptional regulator [Alphaproteobacteria bacterium]|nr:LysR family transcriptional regulator [Alphaproteobacteria bacterium]